MPSALICLITNTQNMLWVSTGKINISYFKIFYQMLGVLMLTVYLNLISIWLMHFSVRCIKFLICFYYFVTEVDMFYPNPKKIKTCFSFGVEVPQSWILYDKSQDTSSHVALRQYKFFLFSCLSGCVHFTLKFSKLWIIFLLFQETIPPSNTVH